MASIRARSTSSCIWRVAASIESALRKLPTTGMVMAARMPMMEITTSISTSVKAELWGADFTFLLPANEVVFVDARVGFRSWVNFLIRSGRPDQDLAAMLELVSIAGWNRIEQTVQPGLTADALLRNTGARIKGIAAVFVV